MSKACIAMAALLGGAAAASTPSLGANKTGIHGTGMPPCDALEQAGLGNRLLYPTDAGYDSRIKTWWATNNPPRPYCLVQPHNTQEVSTALTALVNTKEDSQNWHIALRSGAHAPTSMNTIDDGVTIDLGMMNSSSYDPKSNIARIDTGGKWKKVFADLNKSGVTVAGGRDGGVGVGGFLLGGGVSFFHAKVGWSCDTIVNYEVVLANGTIVNANKDDNADLWVALKGGSNNFGIVTRFDMKAMPAKNMIYEEHVLNSSYSNALVDVATGFANQKQSEANDALIAFLSYDGVKTPGIIGTGIHVNLEGKNASSPYDKLRTLPSMASSKTTKSMAQAAEESQEKGGLKRFGFTLTYKNDPKITHGIVDLHAQYVEKLKHSVGAKNFTTMLFLEPIPSFTREYTKQNGGNMLGIEDVKENAMLVVFGAAITNGNDAALAIARTEGNKVKTQIEQLFKSHNGGIDLVYANYADTTQDPIASYGPANVKHIRDVAARYDPAAVFQKRISKGFKIPAAA